jgi:hypothetical protein
LRARLFPVHRRQQYLAWIITGERAGISKLILSDL